MLTKRKARLTGPAWDGTGGTPVAGTVVEVTLSASRWFFTAGGVRWSLWELEEEGFEWEWVE